MAKRIILLSDGTGNSAAKVWRTNVWRIFQALDLSGNDQVAIYDDGVGSSAFKPLALFGGAFGWGLKRNVIDLYKFACRNYSQPEPGETPDEIYAFGFSRGAFTIRIVVALILNQGLVRASDERELDRLARAAYRAYRAERYRTMLRIETVFRAIRDAILRSDYDRDRTVKVDNIRFVGLWDTVAAYGLPIEEMTIGVSRYLWPLMLPDRRLDGRVQRACHALSVDDERTTFHPVLWTEADEKSTPRRPDGFTYVPDERISQVWFAGVHSNVGGGYPDDSLAHIPLLWMMGEARACGLVFKENSEADPAAAKFDPDAFRSAYSHQDKDGRLYDSRAGLGGYYRYGPRRLDLLCAQRFSGKPHDAVVIGRPKIHEKVLQRIANRAHAYAPAVLPKDFDVVMADDGRIVPLAVSGYETPDQSAQRIRHTEQIWNDVWRRRAVYFATVATSLGLFGYPLLRSFVPADEYLHPLRWLSEIIRLVGTVLPGSLDLWVNAWARSPHIFLAFLAMLVALLWLGSTLSARINSRMNRIWTRKVDGEPAMSASDRAIMALRRNGTYQASLRVLKWRLFPLLSAVLVLYLAVAVVNRAAFNAADAAGWICAGTEAGDLRRLEVGQQVERLLHTDRLCQPTGLFLEQRGVYRIVFERIEPTWYDGPIPTGLSGFEALDAPRWWQVPAMMLGTPLRRSALQAWMRISIRIGVTGAEELHFLPDPNATDADNDRILQARPRMRAGGELFLYVNDAVLALPGLTGWFYANNRGTARVTVTRLP